MAFSKEIINAISYASSNGFQIHPDAFSMLKGLECEILPIIKNIIKIKNNNEERSVIVLEDIKNIISLEGNSSIKNQNANTALSIVENKIELNYEVIESSTELNTSEGIDGFTALFRSRFHKIMSILAKRPESKKIIKISQLKQNKTDNNTTDNLHTSKNSNNNSFIIAGLLMNKKVSRNSTEITIDDMSGILKSIAKDEEIRKQVSMLALDQMVMMEIEKNNQKYIVKRLNSPDIPEHIPTKSQSEIYAVLISDLHVGSKHFLENEFMNFLNWLATSEDEIVSKIKYVCIGGDIIDGIGIFPNQDKELTEFNIENQMDHVTNLISKIPQHMKIFVIPGNHDPGRRALPQPPIPYHYSKRIYSLSNVIMLGNPSTIKVEGINILMYHGQGLDDIIATTPGLSYSKPAEAMKIMLKARHLSPSFGQRTPLAPEIEDRLVITDIPDILHSGHVHIADVQNYKGTLIVNSGTWQGQTQFQQTMGIEPTPAIAMLVNLSTLQPFKLEFNQSLTT